jgi:A/G-specific adenine glycosylase
MPKPPDPLDVVVNKAAIRRALLSWYDRAGRDLPWRSRDGRADAYRVWLSEIMLQQTTVAAVKPYFARFVERWPRVTDLAAAPRAEVLAAWAGLGYYSRARNLHACAEILARDGFPADEAGWRKLPGVGPYTAAAVAAIALGQTTNVVDGNVERVMSRLFAVETPLPQAKPSLAALAGRLIGPNRPGDWAQSLMDLGATVCTPRTPSCTDCPLRQHCAAAGDKAGLYPRKSLKKVRPERFGVAFVLRRGGDVWIATRPDKGLLGGMAALPSTDWRAEPWSPAEAAASSPSRSNWHDAGAVRHVFTHFALTLTVLVAAAPARDTLSSPGQWIKADQVAGLPTVFAKALARGLAFSLNNDAKSKPSPPD